MEDKRKTKKQLLEDVSMLRRRVDELERREIEGKTALKKLLDQENIYSILLENIPQMVFFKNKDSIYVFGNDNFAWYHNTTQKELAGMTDFELFPKEVAEKHRSDDQEIMKNKETREIEEKYLIGGEERIVNTIKTAVVDNAGEVIGILGIFTEVTEKKRAEEELRRHRDELERLVEERTAELSRKTREITELSTPIMQIWEGIIIAPLIGTLDSERTQQFMERLLDRIVATGSPVAIVDITGVPYIDTQTAQHLIETISAVKLLGSQTILTGVRPAIAQTLVHLGIDLGDVLTRPSLVSGLRWAINEIGDHSSMARDTE